MVAPFVFLEFLKNTKDKIIHYFTDDDASKLIEHFGAATNEYPELKNYGVVKVSKKKFSAFGVINYESVNTFLSKLESDKNKEETPTKLIRVEALEEAKSYEEVEEDSKNIIISKDIVDVVNRLNSDFKALILIAKKIDNCYKKEPLNEQPVFNWKKYVANSFKKIDGVKFIDLYLYGYIESFLKDNSSLNPEELNDKLSKFLEKPIFFVNRGMKIQEVEIISSIIFGALSKRTDYIAIHSLGSATTYVKQVFENDPKFNLIGVYKRPVIDEIDKTVNLPEYSIIWYTPEGKQIYNYVS